VVLGHGGIGHALAARLDERRTFAGYWEYVLDGALYTTPAHPRWSGSAVVDMQGRVIGVGSLLIQEPGPDGPKQMNMSVPVDPLEPILDDLRCHGRPNRPPHRTACGGAGGDGSRMPQPLWASPVLLFSPVGARTLQV
jgi:hypothetical protein